MKDKEIKLFMRMAHDVAKLSTAIKHKVGCIIVTTDNSHVLGYNGTPADWSNECEYRVYQDDVPVHLMSYQLVLENKFNLIDDDGRKYLLKSKDEVLHAEINAVAKLARGTISSVDSTAFITLAPCLECAKLLYQSGVSRVYYSNIYRNRAGIDFLEQCNVPCKRITDDV